MRDVDYEKLKENIGEIVDESMSRYRGQYDQIKSGIKERRCQARAYIRENPEKAVLMAAGVGALASMVMIGLLALGNRRKWD
jgi:ElaB/YqjD/DUF883 family membrane-anchored ribosome-binding protein